MNRLVSAVFILAAMFSAVTTAVRSAVFAKSTPSLSSTPIPFPLNPQQGWTASTWEEMRVICDDIASKDNAHQKLTEREWSEAAACKSILEREQEQRQHPPAPTIGSTPRSG